MTTLRRRPSCALRTLLSIAAPALVLAAFVLGAVPGSAAVPGSRSHTRHAFAKPLPGPSFAATAGPRSAKRHKGGSAAAHGAAGSRSATRPSGGHHGRHVQPEPVEDRPAMRRADRRGRGADPFRRAGRRGQSQGIVAEVDRRSSYGAYTAHLHAASGRYARVGRSLGAPVLVAAAPGASASASRPPYPEPAHPYATGVSQPEGYDDMPAATPAGVNIGSAMALSAPGAPARPGQPSPANAQVVSGFGSEVALSSPYPGTTRRRPHPGFTSGQPPFAPPPPANLAERDAITMAAVSPSVLPDLYDHNGRLVNVAPLKGSHEVLVHQNTMAAADGLTRIQDDVELDRLRTTGGLVDFPETNSLHMNPQLPYDRRCARPWTVLFAIDIAHDFFERFHQPLYVTSAVRTVSFQARLQRINGNAAAIDGDAASPHLTGQALDFGKRGMSAAQLAWMRAYLLPLMDSGRIDVEEEFQQACFHISVYRRYASARGSAQVVAQMQGGATPAGTTSQP